MAVHLPSMEDSKDIVEFDNLQEDLKICATDPVDGKSSVIGNTKVDKLEKEKGGNSDPSEEQFSKNLNVREIHETSPFKQAVKGFVLNKLSKKVGTSHILSGITEKIVKKLEENKDNIQPVLVHNSESDLSISNIRIKEPSTEVISNSLSCELKSVVANDLALSEVLNIEDAIECFEEPKTLINDVDIGVTIPLRNEFRSNSISLPSSPAHRFSKRASSISSLLENTESVKKNFNSPDLLFLAEEEKLNDCESKLNHENEGTEIKTTKSSNEDCTNSNTNYLCNAYCSTVEDAPNFKEITLQKICTFFSSFKNMVTSLSLSHIFLLASIMIHNIDVLSTYMAFIFDGLVIAYVIYSYICILVQKPTPNNTLNFPYIDPHLENSSLHIQNCKRMLKGSVKILKGEYDEEMVKNHLTDLVDISIESCCLIIFTPKKKSGKDMSVKVDSTSYDLLGASISLVPKTISKKRIWNKKYPICIVFPCLSKKSNTPESGNDADSTSADYMSTVHQEDEDESCNQKALYIFALTDREKESLFWVLLRNTKDSEISLKSNEQLCDTSLKTDFSSVSYTSLLEMNSDDSISLNKDISEEENLSMTDKSNEVALDFDIYMKTLFENFERMNKFSSRSRSVEDISNLKEDLSKSTDFAISKDDTFLSSNTCEISVDWLNLALGRIFYDFLTQKYWSDDIKARIQKKLDKIEMPTFIESLEVSDVFLGTSLPQIHTVSNPISDVNGIWFNFDFNYCGSFQMTLKTKLKMTKAKQLSGTEVAESLESKQNISAISSESSDDEGNEARISSAKKKKLINRIEKWISHKHFQTVAQSRFVKKYVGDLSNMPLTLTVELNSLHGTLTLNIPPAPTDRIWYGFRKDPVLSLNASPKVGTHEINLSAVVQMIEKKLIQEFKKALVMPNMDDLLVPVMYTPIYDS